MGSQTYGSFHDTICNVTGIRQKEVRSIAEESDLVVIVGGKSSSNTKKLVSVSEEICQTVHIRNAAELPRNLLRKDMTVGVSAGASTPDSVIKEVIQTMSEIKNDEMSFEEMLNQSFKTIRTGEEVTGIVTSVFTNEVHVDLGIKHTGILPSGEVADSESNLAENFKVGDEITVLVQKFNDPEGTVQVSKKRVDSRAGWAKIQEAYESAATLSGKVTSVIKGGILVSDEIQSYFVPASLTGSPKGASLDPMLGQEVAFKIVEIDPAKKRAIASIREVLREQRKALEEQFWAQVAVDQVYTGKVKSLTSYGAFVDLGGVDGMVHITELSWKKIKNPAEVVSVGDEITVFVKEINAETRKISLGYKTEDTNPWNLLQNQYQAGDTATVKIVSLTTFGAFAELIPGIDGLIHISQIADRKIANPAEVLAVGDEVQVEIVDIDYEAHRVSLSMRALLEKEKAEAEDAILAENAQYMAPTEEAAEAPVEE
jgi:4-hydroxy-3-methylbut-2-enyl diphosphate reductase